MAELAMSAPAASAAPSPQADLDRAVAELRDHARELARLPPAQKAALLRQVIPRLIDVAPAWVAEGSKAKGIDPSTSAEEWLAGPLPVVRNARLLADSLEEIARHGRPTLGTRARTREDGRLEVEVFPGGRIDKLL